MIILGIETSCDETSASIINNNKLVSSIVYTHQIHKKYGGVVPELASQEHLNEIIDVIENEGVLVESHGSLIQGIIGVGGEKIGEIIFSH